MNAAEIEELLIKLVQIPAPTGREQKRAEYITDWLKELGYHPFTDAAGNVIVEMPHIKNCGVSQEQCGT